MQAFQVWLYPRPDSNPTMGEKGVTQLVIYLCKRTKVKIADITYLRLLRVRTDQCKYIKHCFTPDRNTKRGNKSR